MTILLVPPTGAAGSSVVFPCLLFLFYFLLSCTDSPWFSFYLFLLIFQLISRTEGVVKHGSMTNLLCSFRIVWRQGARHSWRMQGVDGSLGSKVPGGKAGRTWVYYSYHKMLPPPAGCFGLWSACYFPFVIFPLVLCLTLFTSSGVSLMFSFFFQLVLFQVLTTSLVCRGGGRQIVSFSFLSFLFFSLSICLISFCFLFDCFFLFLYFIECVRLVCRI